MEYFAIICDFKNIKQEYIIISNKEYNFFNLTDMYSVNIGRKIKKYYNNDKWEQLQKQYYFEEFFDANSFENEILAQRFIDEILMPIDVLEKLITV